METLDPIIHAIALSMGAAWASGVNLYATLLVLGVLGVTQNITLPENLMILTHPLVMGASGLMFMIEFVADKIPGVDSGWDAIHTFIRIPAGAVLAAGAVGTLDPALALAAAIVGGGVAAGTHATKAGTRAMINLSPEPFTNWAASLSEDVAAIAGIWTAIHFPYLFLGFLIVFLLLLIWILPKLWRGIRQIFSRLRQMISGRKTDPAGEGS